jgi:TrmH RNA methyltransferase
MSQENNSKSKRPAQPKDSRLRATESKYYGVRACEALFAVRPQDIVRAYLTNKTKNQFKDLMSWCAKRKLAYHLVTDEELAKITSSVHHEGVCILAKQRKRLATDELLKRLTDDPQLLLGVDGVGNPHNLGSILRTAAHFGCRFIAGTKDSLPDLSPSACRIAEGAAEHVELVDCDDLSKLVGKLRQKGFGIIATDCHGGRNLFEVEFPPRACVIIGAEVSGVSPKLIKEADFRLQIPGSGKVESLNVGVATGVIVAEYFRQKLSGDATL